ncbi:MAG: DNA-directed RNA polymerase subunit beta' [Lachnospiraceae bacterium]|nr:DNA-directed RNA polymerase subunit beta' [Lachnospiraceae bacterium]
MSFENKEEKDITYDRIRIGLASPEKIMEWAKAGRAGNIEDYEVKKPETINYRTLKPESDGLFCEKIFGPTKDWECHCGKYKKIRNKGVICDKCHVEVTKATVRRERMGYIKLAAPVSHIWYFKGIPSRMGLILDISPKVLEKVLYFASYIVLDAGETNLKVKDVLTESEYDQACEAYGRDAFRVGMGAEAIRELLESVDLDKESEELRKEFETSAGQKRAKIVKRLEVVEAFKESGNRPEWMVLTVIPVIPPDLRPMVQLDGGRFATSDLNDLYRRIINRNNRLKRLLELGAPELIVRNEKRMLQEAVDALNDNGRRGRAVTGAGNRALKSLSDMLKGKQGRFRQNLLGKRVDYSGRSVIVVGPELKIYQCGLPKEMAIELFKPFVMKELTARSIAQNVKAAKKMVETLKPEVWDVLEDVIREHPVMLNRAPTLHRLGIQAFEPILVEGKAIKLHPLVCTAFNADFDGDQMAVHLPLSVEAQAECRFLMLSPNNLLKPSDGGPVAVPSQDMVLGIYYLTMQKPGEKGEGKFFRNYSEAIMAYENKVITLQSQIKVRRESVDIDGNVTSGIIDTTLGRLIFNEVIPQDLGFVDRTKPENKFLLEVEFLVKKKQLKSILQKCIDNHGATKTAEILDAVKALGYKYSTRAAMTVSVADMTVPASKQKILDEAQETVNRVTEGYRNGIITDDQRYKNVIKIWTEADDAIKNELLNGLDTYNNIKMMADSGARGSNDQIKQLAGMRGLMGSTTGKTIELPIKANFREGLNVLEYFISAHGARKGLSDTALRTADSGYLTRRLVDVTQDIIVRETDCAVDRDEIPGIEVKAYYEEIYNDVKIIESLQERITGRTSCETIYDDNGEVIVKKNQLITPRRAEKICATKAIVDAGLDASVKIRTALSCRSHVGICAKCYGTNLATGVPVQVGEAVGIIAAQSIGEPGTQLTMRNFHSGGIANASDITQGLPRVEELFEARKPKGLAIIAEFGGKFEYIDSKKKREVVITNEETGESKNYLIPYGFSVSEPTRTHIEAGDKITEGSIDPHDLLRIKGLRPVQDYLLRGVQQVYRDSASVDISDKHIEVIVRQMLKKIKVEEIGDSSFLPGSMVDILDFEDENERLAAEGKEVATGERIILGITKASLATNSFLSAASFQETTRVLTDAAIKGKVDPLVGLKENVIIGKIIPAGTGMAVYSDIKLDSDEREARRKAELKRLRQEALEAEKAKRAEEKAKQKEAERLKAEEESEEDYLDASDYLDSNDFDDDSEYDSDEFVYATEADLENDEFEYATEDEEFEYEEEDFEEFDEEEFDDSDSEE